MRTPLKIVWCFDLPEGIKLFAIRRTADMVSHYGRNIRSMGVETLAASCYLQGIEDAFYYHEKCQAQSITQPEMNKSAALASSTIPQPHSEGIEKSGMSGPANTPALSQTSISLTTLQKSQPNEMRSLRGSWSMDGP